MRNATTEQITPAIFESFRKFINQRPGLDPRDYFSDWRDKDGRRAYQSEARRIQKDGTRARKALALAQAYPFDAQALLEACGGAYSGRLSIVHEGGKGLAIDYCTGQYWPTEYRAAAAVVLERYAEAMRPKQGPGGRVPLSIGELKDMSRAAGSHFFDRDSMRFFRSRIVPTIYSGPGGVYFVTSEQGPSNERMFTVRRFDVKDASIDTFGEFNKWTRGAALRTAREAAAAPVPICHNCGGSGEKHSQVCWYCKGTKQEPQENAAA